MAAALPLSGTAYRWGDEFYFYIKEKIEAEHPREEVNVGDLGYWLEGPAFCIFFGRTPASTGAKPRAASPVNVFGKIVSGIDGLREVKSTTKITVSRL